MSVLGRQNYHMKIGNTSPDLTLYLEDGQGHVPDFSGVDTPGIEFFVWKHGSDEYHVRKFGSLAAPQTAKVTMPWSSGETDDAGVYHVVVDVIKSGKRESFPAQGSGTIVMEERPSLT